MASGYYAGIDLVVGDAPRVVDVNLWAHSSIVRISNWISC
jgi:predicted ATP-grasp superfamily ATP-dependent carboligase